MFIGNVKAVKLLKKSIENNRLSQAYLFSGPESVGKFTLAKIFAESAIKMEKMNLETWPKEENNIPDLIILEPEIEEKKGVIKEQEIKIRDIRRIQQELSLFPYGGKYKVLIINNAHQMKLPSQNALLKILEEPNSTSIIILITHHDPNIISTIKSRCQKINFSLVSKKEIEKMSEARKDIWDLFIFSMGRPGLIFKLEENPEERDLREEQLKDFRKFSSWGINERLKLAEKMSADLVKAAGELEFWIWLIRLEIFEKGESGKFFSFKTLRKIEESAEIIRNTNASPRLIIENLFLEI